MRRLRIDIKLTLWYAFSMILLLLFTFIYLLYIGRSVTISGIQSELKSVVIKSASELEYQVFEEDIYDGDDIYIPYNGAYIEVEEDYISEKNEVYTAVYDDEHKLIYGSSLLPDDVSSRINFSKQVKKINYQGINYYIYDTEVEDMKLHGVWLRGITKGDDKLEGIIKISHMALWILPILVVLALLSGYIMARKALKPIENIRESALKISSGTDLRQHIDIGEGDDELHKLVKVFNDMFDRLYASFEKEKRFASDASHELRTPMSVIIAQCDYLNVPGIKESLSKEDYEESIEIIYRQSRRMNNIIKELLDFTRLSRNSFDKLEINLSNLLIQIAEDMSKLKKKDIDLSYDIKEDVKLSANKDLLYRMLTNIISNAYNYGKEQGYIKLRLYTDEENAYVEVEDDGIGISEDDKKHIFERFYRADSSHTGEGTGLGLAMSMEIARWHGGDIEITSELGQGTTFKIIIPLSKTVMY